MLALLGLGTNQGDREDNLRVAVSALQTVPGIFVKRCSSLYETEPVGYTDQPDFYNMVAEVQTELSPRALLGVCLGIEAGMGRIRTFRNAPRIIDIDVLMAEGIHMEEKELVLPHPRMFERAFVIVPILELFPEGMVYGMDLTSFAPKTVEKKVNFLKKLCFERL